MATKGYRLETLDFLPMLAYVFWHSPSEAVDVLAYERALREFQAALFEAPVPGLRACATFRLGALPPWVNGPRAYADWYLVESSADLDPLNQLAVSGARKVPHDLAAHAMGVGAGSLLQLRGERAGLRRVRHSAWLAKPRGTTYDEFYASIDPWLRSPDVSVWRRQMVLGPTTEFAMLAVEPLLLPGHLAALHVPLESVCHFGE